MFFISYYVYANDERGDASDMGNTNNSIVDDNLTNKKPTEWRRLNSNGYSQKYTFLTWIGRDERAVELLQSYGFEWQETRNTIKTISRIHRVYPETILCIIYADSSIGRFLKTAHNYGNVFNTDSGRTKEFDNFEQWIDAIGRYWLNGKYLKHKTTIWQLSPATGEPWPYYATSSENWFINVSNCLGMIHNKQINWDRQFRR